MSAHVLLNLLKQVEEKIDKLQGLARILSLFPTDFHFIVNYRCTNFRFYISYDTKKSLKSRF